MFRSFASLALLGLCSCGTLFNNGKTNVSFSSDPRGAMVTVDGVERGRTPMSLAMDKEPFSVEFSLAGYRPAVRSVDTKVGVGFVLLDIFPGFYFGFIPLVVDLVTGDWNYLDEDAVHVRLEPLGDE